MKVDVEELGACKRRLQVEETPEVVQEAWARAFTRVQREAKLPGFRKGKVPRSMVKLHFSNDVRQEVARHLIPEVYQKALAETQLKPGLPSSTRPSRSPKPRWTRPSRTCKSSRRSTGRWSGPPTWAIS